MDAREYFESVRDAARGMARCLARMEAMRSREGLRGGTLTARGGGCGDPMAATDARVDAEREAERETAQLSSALADGRAVCRGVRAAHPGLRWGDALELRYCDDLSVGEVAAALGVSQRTAHRDVLAALDYVDAVGVAAARAGRGMAS